MYKYLVSIVLVFFCVLADAEEENRFEVIYSQYLRDASCHVTIIRDKKSGMEYMSFQSVMSTPNVVIPIGKNNETQKN